ncbi:radical SAM family heme chaperone HemW [Trichlorobacter lovleyi]|uniref:radical SAM family heme chaperone HemW n=1 Tax=Trichlorobacter lovleyi TaxID=313985 RepID=UPI0022404EE5|nr:radical SAM family heme chaperone HemW [Trichlorobacter lovleyi]QOX78349.1 radical SAM family heme chaperone HemW [Trichlorobacter lovleyi]
MFSRLYLHIPWCLSKCGYCAFSSRPLEPHQLEQTCSLLLQEMELAATAYPLNQPLRSLYFGGGTPSLLTPEQVSRLVTHSRDLFGHSDTIEITLEANPGTVSLDSLTGYCQAGVTRLSLGAQSFNDMMLQTLGRRHTSAETRSSFQLAQQAGFNSIGLDLICGLPGQEMAAWRQDLAAALALQPDHLSIYGLTIEEETPFAGRYPAGSPELPDHDLSADMLEEADNRLGAAGYEHYEIANFARPGCRSQHNCGYWQRDGYLGIGPGAHSFLRQGWGLRWGNQGVFETWAAAIQNNRLAATEQQELTREDALSEHIFLGLRMADGISLNGFAEQFGERVEQRFAEAIHQLQQAGLLSCSRDRLCLTKRGMLLSNQVFVRFL